VDFTALLLSQNFTMNKKSSGNSLVFGNVKYKVVTMKVFVHNIFNL